MKFKIVGCMIDSRDITGESDVVNFEYMIKAQTLYQAKLIFRGTYPDENKYRINHEGCCIILG